MPDDRQTVLVLTRDEIVLSGLERVAREAGLQLADDPDTSAAPTAVVVDLEEAGAMDEMARLRRRFPEALLAAHMRTPRQDLWLEAEALGCDLVANRGALARRLRDKLASWVGRDRPRFVLSAAADVAGRLGCVYRAQSSPVGPLAVYHVEGGLHAVEDSCPHAGAVLSEGELEGPVLTCPRHGSRFDVRTGQRVRGPADDALRTFTLVEDGGYVYLLAPP